MDKQVYIEISLDEPGNGIYIKGYIPIEILIQFQLTQAAIFDTMNCSERLAYLALILKKYEEKGIIKSRNLSTGENKKIIDGLGSFIGKPNLTKSTKKHVKKLKKDIDKLIEDTQEKKIETISNLKQKVLMIKG